MFAVAFCPGRQQVKRHGKDQIHHQYEHADKPCRAAAVGHQRCGHGRDKHHVHRAWPELQAHRLRPDDVAQQHQHAYDKQRDLGRAPQRDAHAQVQPVLARTGKGRGHFRSAAHQRNDDEADKGRRHPKSHRGLLHRLDEDLADQRDQYGDTGQRGQSQPHGPRCFACRRALPRSYSCTWCFSPPSRNDMPSMNNVLVTIAPAIDAFTRVYCPACSVVSAMTSSVRFPSVALSRPPTVSPVLAATDSVAWLSSMASGTMAKTERAKRSVCASGLSLWATNTTGTKTSSQSTRL